MVARHSSQPRQFPVDADETANWACFVQIHPPEISASGIYILGIVADPRVVGSCRIYRETAIAVALTWQDLLYLVDCAQDPTPE